MNLLVWIFFVFILFVSLPVFFVIHRGRAAAKLAHSLVRTSLTPFAPQYTEIYKRTFAMCELNGIPVYFHWAVLPRKMGNSFQARLFCHVKIANSAGVKIWVSTPGKNSNAPQSALRHVSGWLPTDDGFFVAKIAGLSAHEQLPVWSKIPAEVRRQIYDHADRFGSIAIRSGWADFYVGRAHASKLWREESCWDDCLDLQSAIDLNEMTDAALVNQFIHQSAALAKSIIFK